MDGILPVYTACTAFGQAGLLDSTFNADGIVTTDFGSTEDFGRRVLFQSDNKIVVAGWLYDGNTEDFAIARYLTDGSLDESFGNEGKVVTDFEGRDNGAVDTELQPDGKILVVGSYRPLWSPIGTADKIMLARYLPDGNLDASFGTGGIVSTGFDSTSVRGNAIIVQPDGKIVVAGAYDFEKAAFIVLRYLPNGSFDDSFGSNGKVLTQVSAYTAIHAYDLAIRPDGRMVVLGGTISPYHDFLTVQYLPDGMLDSAFGSNGVVITDFGGADFATSIALQPDGKIIVGGSSQVGFGWDFAAARLLNDGTLDNAFGLNGKVKTEILQKNNGESLVVQPDEKIVFAGYASDSSNYVMALVRYLTDGGLDNSFGTGGIVTANIGSNNYSFGFSTTLQSDGKILVAGNSQSNSSFADFAVVRFLSGLSVRTFSPEHSEKDMLIFPNPAVPDGSLTIELDLKKAGKVGFALHDAAGKAVREFSFFEKTVGNQVFNIKTTGISPGVYFLTGRLEKAVLGTEKVVLR